MLEALIAMLGGSEALPFVRSFKGQLSRYVLENEFGTIAPQIKNLRFPGRRLRCHHSWSGPFRA